MSDILFFIKTLFITFIFIVVLQVKVGDLTLEQRAAHWARTSEVMEPVKQAARGGVVVIHQTWNRLTSHLGDKAQAVFKSEDSPGRRHLKFQLDRSTKYLKEQAEKAKQLASKKAVVVKEKVSEKLEQGTEEVVEELKKEGFYDYDDSEE